jgi:23S rRNA (guanosine2251-2'-O)-methyltransferase
METILILHNIRSVYNVGSIFRTADAAGVTKIILTGYTPTPLDRFKRPRLDLQKVALGAEQTVAWEYSKNPFAAIFKLKQEGVAIVAIEQDPRSTSIFSYAKHKSKVPVALVLGNEVRGLSKALLNKCDAIVEIPMRGKKESLNVSVAAGIVLFTITRTLA